MDDQLDTPIQSDGFQHDGDDEGEGSAGAAPAPLALGFILDEPNERKVARHVVKLREEQAAAISRDRATWIRNRYWREGKRFVRLEKKENTNRWRVFIPSGMGNAPPVPNKTDRLCRRLGNVMLVDAPFPDCEPAGDTNEAKESAEFATRYLTVLSGPDQLNLKRILRAAVDKSQTYASAFGWVITDPGGGGHRPRPYLAHPHAQTTEDALTNPLTGAPASEDELQERYLMADGATLTDDPDQADLQWLPAPKVRLLTGLQGRFLPPTARHLSEADGFHITDFTRLGDLRRQFPERMARLTDDQLTTLCGWRPEHVEDILPPYAVDPEECKTKDGKYRDDQIVFTTTVYYGLCSQYPKGCYVVTGGDSLVLHKQPWTAKMPTAPNADGTPKPMQERVMRLPVAQCRCLDDDVTDNGMGIAMAEHLGTADEVAAAALGFEIEHMFRAANPHTFLPIGSIVQPKQLQLRDGQAIMVNPEGRPVVEEVPALSNTVPLLRSEMQEDQNDAIGLQQAAQGVEGSTVKSGIHAQTIVQEALKAISNMKDNAGDFYVILCQILLEQARAYATVPTLLQYTGPDGAYKAREWSRVDFGTTETVAIKKGSFTMHGLIAKQEMANNALDRKVIDADEYTELMAGGLSPILGTQDNPHLLRIRRQLETWKEGPPKAWLAAYAKGQAMFKAQQVQFADAQAQAQGMLSLGVPPDPTSLPPQPQEPPLPPTTIFLRRPADLEPMPAKIRHRQLQREQVTAKFDAMPEPWQRVLLAEYTEMANAAGVMTVPQVQAAKAAAEAAMPPALPKGVSIDMKGDASTVAAEEQAAVQGFKGAPGAPPAPAAPAPPAAPTPAGV